MVTLAGVIAVLGIALRLVWRVVGPDVIAHFEERAERRRVKRRKDRA